MSIVHCNWRIEFAIHKIRLCARQQQQQGLVNSSMLTVVEFYGGAGEIQ